MLKSLKGVYITQFQHFTEPIYWRLGSQKITLYSDLSRLSRAFKDMIRRGKWETGKLYGIKVAETLRLIFQGVTLTVDKFSCGRFLQGEGTYALLNRKGRQRS